MLGAMPSLNAPCAWDRPGSAPLASMAWQRTQLTVIKGLLQRSCRMLFASQKASSMPCCSCMDWPTSTSSFAPTRTLQRQEHVLSNWFEVTDSGPLVVLNTEQKLHGYLLLSRRRRKLYVYEVAADTWPATFALLHAHAQLLEAEPEPPQEMSWPLPPTDPTFYFLAEHMPVRSEMLSFPNGGWMARIVHMPTLLQSLLPLWQKY